MPWEFIIVLVIAVPVVLFPIAFIWYLKTSGILDTFPQRKSKVDNGNGTSIEK